IFFLYGIVGICLLLFLNRKAKTIFIWGITLFLLFGIATMMPDDGEELFNQAQMAEYVLDTADVSGMGTYNEIRYYRNTAEDPLTQTMSDGEFLVLMFISPLALAPMFLFGMYAAKRKIFYQPKIERKSYIIIIILGLGIGFGMKGYGFY